MSGLEFERNEAEVGVPSAGPALTQPEPAQEYLHEFTYRPPALGLYDPSLEKDSCGVGFIANIKGKKSHQIVSDAINILCNLEHRGAVGADPRAGDGAGILVQIPHTFFARKAKEAGFTLPKPGEYAVGAIFMPREKSWRKIIQSIIADQVENEKLTLIGWREVPTDNSSLGETVKPTEPHCMQVFIGRGKEIKSEDDFERKLYILRKSISQAIYQRRDRGLAGYYPASLSCRTVVYKGMFLADQLGKYYPDLHEKDFESALALVHQRFSTNTFPAWSLAHPYRMVAHNGEINTLRGNVNWMAARQASVQSKLYGKDISRLWPISYEGQSDTACFDNGLEFLVQGGYSLAHAVMMMIPEAWAGNPLMDEERRSFYEYHAALMEPWDGPAAIAFTDGRQIGATLDRNGLRPARYLVTKDDRIVMASEMGVLKIPEDQFITKWRLQPGKMLLVDLEEGRLIPDDEIKAQLAKNHPYREWLTGTQIVLEDMKDAAPKGMRSNLTLLDRQQAFGYTQEDIGILMTPMASTGEEANGSMGNDSPISALSNKPKPLFTYFKQNFAQVTNPPIDPIREELVMSLVSIIGPRPNLFDVDGQSQTKRLEVRQPILTDADMEKIRSIADVADNHFKSRALDTTFHAGLGAAGLEQVLDELCARAESAVRDGVNIIILSDRAAGSDRIPIPSLLACAAVHHHLIRTGLRTSVGLVVESGEPREVHHFACLAGYGAEAINPYLAFESIIAMKDKLPAKLEDKEIVKRYIKSIGKGLLKVMSKMGISTYQSYCGAQIFDAVGLKDRHGERQRLRDVLRRQVHREALKQRYLHRQRGVGRAHDLAGQRERERRAELREEQQALRGLEICVRRDGCAAAGMHLEMQMRRNAVRIARVTEVADHLAGLHVRSALQPACIRHTRHARPTVVVLHRQVVVQMDVLVHRSAVAIEIEHAAGAGRGRPERDLAALDRDDRRLLHTHQVVALMRAAGAGLAEVVAVGHIARHREDQQRNGGRLRVCSRSRPGEAECQNKEQDSSGGCAAAASHRDPVSRSKAPTLQRFV